MSGLGAYGRWLRRYGRFRDLADLFSGEDSTYRLGVEGLEQALSEEFGDELAEIIEDTYFEEEPRRLDEILAAEQELFDRARIRRLSRAARTTTMVAAAGRDARHPARRYAIELRDNRLRDLPEITQHADRFKRGPTVKPFRQSRC